MEGDANREKNQRSGASATRRCWFHTIDKKKSGKKNIFFLTTMDDEIQVSKDQRVQPKPIVYYGHEGVDVVHLVFIGRIKATSTRTRTNALIMSQRQQAI